MAASKRRVATMEATAITPSQTLKAPMSEGVHMRVSRGATSNGSACAAVAPARTVLKFFQKSDRGMLMGALSELGETATVTTLARGQDASDQLTSLRSYQHIVPRRGTCLCMGIKRGV